MKKQTAIPRPKQKLARNLGEQIPKANDRHQLFKTTIREIPRGKVATYGQIAEAAGCPRGHRLVARFLSEMNYKNIPWQRVVGADGELKTSGKNELIQRSLLKNEGVHFSGKRIDVANHRHIFEK